VYTYLLIEDGPFVHILYDGLVIDEVGPWDSVDSASHWAESYVNRKNAGIPDGDSE